MTAASRELARLRYLAAMGYSAYVTRRELPGALPTVKLALRQACSVTANGNPAPETAAGGVSRAPESLRVLLDENNGRATAAVRATPPSRQARPEARDADQPRKAGEPGGALRFRLAALVCADRLWLEDLGDGVLAVEQRELVASIGRALKHPGDCEEPRVLQFDWPMHDNDQLELNGDEAMASLQGFLSRQLDDHRCVELICLGDAAWNRIRGLGLPCASRRIPSTLEVLQQPSLKREIWKELQPH